MRRLCSDHFQEKYIHRLARLKLKDDAVPTRFKKFPEHLKKVTGLVHKKQSSAHNPIRIYPTKKYNNYTVCNASFQVTLPDHINYVTRDEPINGFGCLLIISKFYISNNKFHAY